MLNRSEPYSIGPPTFGHCPFGLGHLFREELSKLKWAYPCFWRGLTLAQMVWGTYRFRKHTTLQNGKNGPKKSAPECPVECGGGGSNRYLGNAQMEGASKF